MGVLVPNTADPNETILGMPQFEFSELAQSIVIAIPHRPTEGTHKSFFHNNGIWASMGTIADPMDDQFGGFIEVFRGNIARNFLNYCSDAKNSKIDKLVMIDNDQAVDWSAPYRLAMWDLPVVSGVVCNRSPVRGIFACFTVKDEFGVPRFPSVRYTGKLPSKGLLPVHTVGAGLICIKKQVLQDIFDAGEMPFEVDQKTRRSSLDSGVLKHGEDSAFCFQAQKCGHQIFVDLAVHADHFKREAIRWPARALDESASPENFKIDMRDYFHG